MGRSQESFHKKEVRKRKQKKRQDKQKKKLERKDSDKPSGLDDMIAYVDENGMLTDTPPDLTRKKSTTKAADIEVSIPKRDASEPGHKVKQGRLTFLNEIKGYGFINENGTGQSVFVHVSDFQDEINKGDQVSFEIGKGQRGPSAFNVKRLK